MSVNRASVKFLASWPEFGLSLTSNEAMLTLKERVLGLQLSGSNLSPEVIGEDEISARSNYFIGSNADKWLHDIANYQRVRYLSVYPGIDLVYYGQGQENRI